MKKRLISLLMAALMITALLPVTLAADAPSDWAKDSVNASIEIGLVPSNLQSNYSRATTRAEFCALAVGLYETMQGTITGRVTFSDTSDVNVEKAASIGIVSGVGDNRFNPNANLTREQAATMLARLASAIGKPIPATAPGFNDNGNISAWASASVGQMQYSGIMSGMGNNIFAPKNSYTREQSISTILRVYTYKNLVDTHPPYNTETTSTYLDAVYPTTGKETVTMGGKSYKNAILLYSSEVAKISFNIEGKYTTLTGIIGPSDDAYSYPTTVNVYGDGKILQTFEIPTSGLPVSFSLNVSGVRNLVFESVSNCAVGVAELMLDTTASSTPTIPTTPTPQKPVPAAAVNLVDTHPPYNTETTSTYFDAVYPTTGKETVTMGGKSYKNAILLYSSEVAKISFNIEGKYTTLTGIIGPSDDAYSYPTTVNVYGDGKILQTFEVPTSGLPVSFSLNVSGVRDLVFESVSNCAVGVAELKIK